MHILVTGGAGYIGSHFIKQLLATTDHTVVVLDNFSQGQRNRLTDRRVEYVEVDLRDQTSVENVFFHYPIALVVHFAALASVPDSVKNPLPYYDVNISGGLHLLRAMAAHGVKKIIFSSSAAVYGEPQVSLIDEGQPKQPINPYGYTKLIFEQILADQSHATGLSAISFRYFCAAGSDESGELAEAHVPETHIIPVLLETVLGQRPIFNIFGIDYPTPDGTAIRDYIHVNDLATAHLAAMKKLLTTDDAGHWAYNLGTNHGFSVLEVVKAVEEVAGTSVPVALCPRRAGDPSTLVADARLARQELGWQPQYTTIQAIVESAYRAKK